MLSEETDTAKYWRRIGEEIFDIFMTTTLAASASPESREKLRRLIARETESAPGRLVTGEEFCISVNENCEDYFFRSFFDIDDDSPPFFYQVSVYLTGKLITVWPCLLGQFMYLPDPVTPGRPFLEYVINDEATPRYFVNDVNLTPCARPW